MTASAPHATGGKPNRVPLPVTRIGLLFVHGIGQQARFEHLLDGAAELSELMLQTEPDARIVTLDRTADWKLPPGVVDPTGLVPLTLTYVSSQRHIVFECRETWWADLGSRSGLFDTLGFWLWALGQWAAPIYRILDASRMSKLRKGYTQPLPSMSRLPGSIAGQEAEPGARIKLAVTALAALLIGLTWVMIKRVFSKLLGTAPSPTLIVQYVGDVHTYEERASPGQTNLSDPGFPRRVAIRRRMVTEMVAMAASSVDHWFVVAHSLGTILAYNGLTELGHTLPNYLPEAQWRALRRDLKHDQGCRRRPRAEIPSMMPARPPWLADADVLNRPRLFAKLRGLLTYGSPLDKFAALWPRIVATATDRRDKIPVFPPTCEWLNYVAPQDPVAGWLDYFPADRFNNAIPQVSNKRTRLGGLFGLAHILYFTGSERFRDDELTLQKRQIVRWLFGDISATSVRSIDPERDWQTFTTEGILVALGYIALLTIVWLAASALLTAVGGLTKALFGASTAVHMTLVKFWHAMATLAPPFLGYALTLVMMLGLWRWFAESGLNLKLARADQQADLSKPGGQTPSRTDYWLRLVRLVIAQRIAAGIFFWLAAVVVGHALLADMAYVAPFRIVDLGRFAGFLAASAGIFFAANVQARINGAIKPARRM